ncbi:PilC/PilY family type IV pilus protein [Caenimonas terrae]|uniref:PilC/PilY family type IV pilus protein n=1 Tax=Caenimonas terrae TaxID=696074 RepID=A0ABW0NF01_9BURK
MFQRQLKWLLGAAVLATNAITLHAQMAQDPLLSRTAAVEPNIVFIFDDSGSMVSTAIYQYGGGAGYQGNRGPNDDAECIGGSGCVWTGTPPSPYGRSPDVNLIYYDPRVTYKIRVNADGTPMAAGSTTGISSWNVYFYKPPAKQLYSVTGITLDPVLRGRGYPATPPALPLSFFTRGSVNPAATGQATTASTYEVTDISVNPGNWSTTNNDGQAVTIGLPSGSPNVAAAGTINTYSLGTAGITSITNNTKKFTVPDGTACSVTFSNAGAGTLATATAVLPTGNSGARAIQTFTVTNPGSGYSSSTIANVTCGGTTQTYAVTTSGSSATYSILNVTVTVRGLGFDVASPPSVTFPAATGGGISATGAVTLGQTNYVNSVTLLTGGSYSACPTDASVTGGSGAVVKVTCSATGSPVVINKKWDGLSNPNGLAAGKGPVSAGDYFSTGTPAGYLPDAGSPLAPGATLIPYPNTTSSSYTYPKFRNRTDCAGNVCTWAEEVQNYANWKTYHRTRLDLAKTGIGLAFQPLNPTFRLGWGTINNLADSTPQLDKGVRLFTPTVQSDFLTWLYGLSAPGSTPSRIALDNVGKYYQRADSGGPWAASPTGSGSISVSGTEAGHATCRRSYSMLMTDGYYNDSFSVGGTGDYDSSPGPTITQPRAYAYAPIGPYSDAKSSTTKYLNTMADVAMKYWVTDLRPDLANNVKPVTGDEAYWQHMGFYAIGLGLIGTLDATDPAVLQALTGYASRTLDWPVPAINDPKAIDDMWHATVNSRGKMLNAKTADELNGSIQQMMSDIGGKEGTQSGVAVSTISLTKDTRKYTPMYTPITWTGNVIAYNLDQATANQSTIAWQVETLVSTDPITGIKTYASTMPPAAARNILVGNGATSGTRAVPFDSSMPSGLITAMGTGANASLINYLRGDKTNEDNSTTSSSPTAIYRGRQTVLGDIVNSTPVFVKDSLNMQYDLLPSTVTGQSTYQAFVAAKKARAEGVLFVGANDGMLHAFRDGTYGANDVPIIPGGVEVFAYVPNALLPTLSKLADKAYVHQYYVDGPNSETDAYLASKSRWANIVLGSTGAGAGAPSTAGVSPRSAVFAIDATSLNTSVTGMNASSVLWEASSNNSSFAELGYVLTDIQAGVTVGGQWVAVFGNGYESKSCQARLFVVDLDTGALIKEINTGAGACSTGNRNGLGGVRLVRNANQQVVGAYAGDLLGNMWKFNLNAASSSGWGVDLSGQPLMKSGPSKPITAAPSVLTLPIVGTTDPKPGYMVIFGTGKFYEVPDITTTATQSLYGIWDKLTFGTGTIPTGSALIDTSLLVQQSIGAAQTSTSGNTYFAVTSNPIDYTGASPKRGWFIDMPNTGQRLVYPLDILADRFAVADTISPANVSVDPCSNTSGGVGFLYIIDALNGGGPSKPVLDTNGDGNVDSSDLVVSGLQGSADGRNVSIIVSKNDLAVTYANVGGGAPGATIIKIDCSLTNTCGTTSPGVRHQWRQLFLR